ERGGVGSRVARVRPHEPAHIVPPADRPAPGGRGAVVGLWPAARRRRPAGARAEGRRIALGLDDDPARIDLSLELPDAAVVTVVADAAGGSDLAGDLAGMRDDLDVVAFDGGAPASGPPARVPLAGTR